MAIYSKGSRPYRGPYSPDYVPETPYSKVTGLDRDSYDPCNTAAEARQGSVVQRNVDGRGYDLSGVLDSQRAFGTTYDQGGGDWQREKSNASDGGFSGPVKKLGSPSASHPKRGMTKRDTL